MLLIMNIYIRDADMRACLLVLQVKSSPVPDSIVGESVPNLLSYLLPRQISDLFQSTSVNLNNLLSRSEAMSQEATLTARSTLSSVGLPGSLELANANMIGMYICIIYIIMISLTLCVMHCIADPLPASVWSKIVRLQEMGGFKR